VIKVKVLILAAAFFFALAGTAQAQTTGKIVGLALIIEYPDKKTVHTREQVEEAFNRVGGMNGNSFSIYDYFKHFSHERLELTHKVTPVITLPFTHAQRGDVGGRALLREAMNVLNTMDFDMSGVTLNNRGEPLLNTMLLSTPRASGSFALTGTGISWTRMSSNPNSSPPISMVVLAHEISHAMMGWVHPGESARGRCLMKKGWGPNPYYRHIAGWIDPVDITNMPSGTKLTIEANSNQAFMYRRSANEAFYIEARATGYKHVRGVGRGLDESGLLIWHYNQDGAKGTAANATGFWRVELVHANGRSEMRNSNRFALFRHGVRTRFDNTTTPSSAWRDGTPSGLSISRISAAGNTMSFTVGFENYIDEMLPEVKFLDDIYASATAASNVVVTLNENLTLNTLINFPAPRTQGATVTIRSANPARPVTITRGVAGNLFTVPNRTTLILEHIIIDGGGRGNFISDDDDDDDEDGEADDNDNVIVAAPKVNDESEDAPAAGTAAVVAGSLVRVNSGGTFIMENGAVLRNNVNSGNGGGVFVNTRGTFTMNGGEITGNTSGNEAGGVLVNTNAAFTMTGGKINGNTAKNSGGVYARRSAFTMNGGEISGNTSATAAGGVRVHIGTFTMSGGQISGNTAAGDGGGVLVAGSGSAFTMNGGEISGNTAGGNGSGIRRANGTVNLNGGVVAGTGRNAAAVVSGTHNLNKASPSNAVIIAWNRPSGTLNYTAGSNTHLTVSSGATATWANQGGVSGEAGLGISYRNGSNTGWLRLW